MPPSARDQVRAEILDRISREPSGISGRHPLLPILRIACVPIVLFISASLLPTLQPPHPGEFPLAVAFEAREPPARAFVVSDPPASSSQPIASAPPRFAGPGTLESAQLSVVETSDGLARIAQLRIPAKDPSLEIHWIIE